MGDESHFENATFPGLNVDNGVAEQMLTNARAVVKLDHETDPKAVAALDDAGLTVYHAVRRATDVLFPGTQAVVIGAGGLCHIGTQTLATITSTGITVIDQSEEALELTKTVGADHTVVAGRSSDPNAVTKQV